LEGGRGSIWYLLVVGWGSLKTSLDFLKRKSVSLSGLNFDELVVQPVVSHYTDQYFIYPYVNKNSDI
jgi:hypothetical protein